jgi:hypothetical protein
MPHADYVICNQAGSMIKCKGCPAAKPHARRIPCPMGKVTYAITKFIGTLTYKDGKWKVLFNGQEIPGLVPNSKFHKMENTNKQMVFWATEYGIETYRHLMPLLKH